MPLWKSVTDFNQLEVGSYAGIEQRAEQNLLISAIKQRFLNSEVHISILRGPYIGSKKITSSLRATDRCIWCCIPAVQGSVLKGMFKSESLETSKFYCMLWTAAPN
jgi:hypothetical protein